MAIFKCKICNKIYRGLNSLNCHIKKEHNDIKYYNLYLKKDLSEGFCKICNNPTEFQKLSLGYKNTCSNECSKKYIYEQTKKSNLKRYGVENSYQREDIKKKIKKTNRKKYGVNMPLQNKKIKEKAYKTIKKIYGVKNVMQNKDIKIKAKKTKLERYGNEKYQNRKQIEKTNLEKYNHKCSLGNKEVRKKRDKTMKKLYGSEHALRNKDCREKFKKTSLKRYGVEYPAQNPKIFAKTKQTCLERYGVEYPVQNPKIYFKYEKSSFKIKKFKNTNLYYQGSYELDFLEKYYDKFPDIKRGPSIKYIFEEKNKVYYPDFFIPSKNLIIEIKNSYLAKKDKKINQAKKEATINEDYNFIMIIDKDYSKLFT